MLKRLFIGVTLLLVGAIIGGVAILALKQERAPQVITQLRETPTVRAIDGRGDFSDVVEAVSPAVVNISADKTAQQKDPFFEFFNDFFSPMYEFGQEKREKEHSTGSGVIISESGYIVTNYHVVSGADKIKVTLFDKRVFNGKLVGADPKTDIAVVKVPAEGLPNIPWGDSDNMRVGQFVLAIGNPFGLNHTVTLGIISALGRANVGIADYEDFIQTDAAINPGNSGGPLVNSKGALVGINTAIFSKSGGYQGIGFAVPSNMARAVMQQLIETGKVTRGWLGVSIQELTAELAKQFGYDSLSGTLVSETMLKSPAQIAGIKSGDIIIAYEGKDVKGPSEFRNMVASSRPGETVNITIIHDGKSETLKVVIGEMDTDEQHSTVEPSSPQIVSSAFSGLSVIELTEDITRQLNLPAEEAYGVVIIGVEDGTEAEEAGLKRGDVIQEVNRAAVKNMNDYKLSVSKAEDKGVALLFINRGGQKFYITVKASTWGGR
jgi:serine protease Do